LCVSTLSSTGEGKPENKMRTGEGNTDNPTLGEETLVFRSNRVETGDSAPVFLETGHSLTVSSSSSRTRITNTLVIEREALEGLGLSSRVIKTLLYSRRVPLLKVYSSCIWSRCNHWCQVHSGNPRNPGISTILDFLQEGIDRDLQLSTIVCQESILSSVLFAGSSGSLADKTQVARLL
ncbi:hypothetical protein UY3_05962, partial [Chelonia mydas]